MRIRGLSTIVMLAMSLLSNAPMSVAAQQGATETCPVPHRSAAAILESAAGDGSVDPFDDPVPYAGPEGTLADSDTAEGVRQTVNDFISCGNAGDFLGLFSLVTNDFLTRYSDSLDLAPELLAPATPVTLPEDEQIVIGEVRDIVVRADGRVAALVVLASANGAEEDVNLLVTFAEQDDRWLIDDWPAVDLDDAGAWTVITGDGYRGSIVSLDDVADFVMGLSGVTVQGAWLPDASQIAQLEAELGEYLVVEIQERPLADRLVEYGRQYAGYVADGHAYILVNAFCHPDEFDWENQAVFVMDGGSCFFQVTFDPATSTFQNLHVNGDA
jgi:hypothetical protein